MLNTFTRSRKSFSQLFWILNSVKSNDIIRIYGLLSHVCLYTISLWPHFWNITLSDLLLVSAYCVPEEARKLHFQNCTSRLWNCRLQFATISNTSLAFSFSTEYSHSCQWPLGASFFPSSRENRFNQSWVKTLRTGTCIHVVLFKMDRKLETQGVQEVCVEF